MKFIIPRELAQAIVDYLEQKPHKEVRQLIDAMMRLEKLEDKPVIKSVEQE